MAGMNMINSATQAALGWTNGTYVFPSLVRRHQLVVDGDAGDVAASSAGNGNEVGTAFHGGQGYVVFNSITGRVQVMVNDAVTRIALQPGGSSAAPGDAFASPPGPRRAGNR